MIKNINLLYILSLAWEKLAYKKACYSCEGVTDIFPVRLCVRAWAWLSEWWFICDDCYRQESQSLSAPALSSAQVAQTRFSSFSLFRRDTLSGSATHTDTQTHRHRHRHRQTQLSSSPLSWNSNRARKKKKKKRTEKMPKAVRNLFICSHYFHFTLLCGRWRFSFDIYTFFIKLNWRLKVQNTLYIWYRMSY